MRADDHNEGHRTVEGEDQRRAQLVIDPQAVDDPLLCDDMANNSELSEERSVDGEITGGSGPTMYGCGGLVQPRDSR